MFNNFLNNDLYNMFNNIFLVKNKTHSIIEPLTCFISLSILEFIPIGTKISILYNKISYHNPNFIKVSKME